MPTTNLLILVFILAMILFWAYQGLFSSFLHCLIVIIAGTLALAFWEPLAFLLLGTGTVAAKFAWGVSLLLLFMVLLIILRLVMDQFVRGNVAFIRPLDLAGGAFFGFLSALLTSGLVLIGVSFTPIGVDVGGYQRFVVNVYGQVERNPDSQLWIGVDDIAGGFYSGLAGGVFWPAFSETSLGEWQPTLADRAGLFRVGQIYDPYASLIASPETVQVTEVSYAPTPVDQIGIDMNIANALTSQAYEALRQQGNQLVLISTTWSNSTAGTFDEDSTLRVPPSQVRLIGRQIQDSQSRDLDMAQPIGVSRTDPALNARVFTPIADNLSFGYAFPAQNELVWAFVVPANAQLDAVLVRNLTIPLPEAVAADAVAMQALMGRLPTSASIFDDDDAGEAAAVYRGEDVGEQTGTSPGHTARAVSLSNQVPIPFSRNEARSLNYTNTEPPQIRSGSVTVPRAGNIGTRNRVQAIYHANHLGSVRLEIQAEHRETLFGAARAAAANLSGVYLTDNNGQPYMPIGYVLEKPDGTQIIDVRSTGEFQSAAELPVNQMNRDDKLFLYFHIPKGVLIVQYNIGSQITQEVYVEVD